VAKPITARLPSLQDRLNCGQHGGPFSLANGHPVDQRFELAELSALLLVSLEKLGEVGAQRRAARDCVEHA
jgi:hypothetical protein